jgi:hypothetical protein
MSLYRVLRGQHAQGEYPKGHVLANTPIVYDPGDIVESEKDLLSLNGKVGSLGPKFELVHDDRLKATDKINVTGQSDDSLDGMTVAQLREMAESDSIDISSAKNKAEIIAAIRTAYAAA